MPCLIAYGGGIADRYYRPQHVRVPRYGELMRIRFNSVRFSGPEGDIQEGVIEQVVELSLTYPGQRVFKIGRQLVAESRVLALADQGDLLAGGLT